MQHTASSHKPPSTHTLTVTALFTAFLCASSYISIPLPTGSHLSLLNLVVLLVALLFPVRQALLIIIIWLLLGIIGIPVFVGGNAGISYLMSGWGGYSLSFIAIGILLPLLRSSSYRRAPYTILSIVGVCLIDLAGMGWLMLITQISVTQAFCLGFLPFLPLDLVKAAAAAQLIPSLRRILLIPLYKQE